MAEIACAITGHRPKSFPWKYNETAPDCVLLKETLVHIPESKSHVHGDFEPGCRRK